MSKVHNLDDPYDLRVSNLTLPKEALCITFNRSKKTWGLASTTRSPNVSNVFSHVRPSTGPSPFHHRLKRITLSDEDEEQQDESIYGISESFKRYELMTEL